MAKPPVLEYQTPMRAKGVRRVVAIITITIGLINGVLGILGLLTLPLLLSDSNFWKDLPSLSALIWIICTVVCAITYTIGGTVILRPRQSWEVVILDCAAIQFCILLLLTGWQVTRGIDDPSENNWILRLCVYSLHAVSAGTVFGLVRLVWRRECNQSITPSCGR